MSDKRPRILSGVQPSGALHLGNYFGAIKQHIELQAEGECYFFIADYHALTSVKDAAALRQNVRDVALTYLALGLDPARTVFYRQSDVPEVTELMWLLLTSTNMGLLERAHSYKEKVAKGITPSVGLFTYPALMAADILAPQGELVPVGQDQDQHVEMARDMVESFHAAYGRKVFTLPKARMSPAPRVPGTTFEKGAVLQVNESVRFEHQSWSDAQIEAWVTWQTERVQGAISGGSVDTTEALVQALREQGGPPTPVACTGGDVRFAVAEQVFRTVGERPTSRFRATRDGDALHLEYYVPLTHVLFVTKANRRQAAKMSKSYGNTIPIFAEGKALKKLVMGIETRLVDLEDPLDAEEDLVLALYRLLASPSEVADLEAKYRAGGFGYGRAKQALLEKIDAHFAPARARRRELEADPAFVDGVLRAGAEKVRALARRTLAAARSACGL